ncbi:MAG: hypothetical protein ACU0BB_02995 [Paracoccaceae bacterium]|jgi:hypothetical protein
MRAVLPILAFGLLSACDPTIPDSGAGIGFDDIGSTPAETTPGQTINGDTLVAGGVVSSETTIAPASATTTTPLPTVATTTQITPATTTATTTVAASDGSDIAAETAAALSYASTNSGVAPVEASPANPAPVPLSNPGISDENDFAAVSSRQTIESDAERLQQNQEQFQVVEPTALPQRSGSTQPNVVQYALSTSNPKGQRIYTRAGINMKARNARNCATYASPDQAQIDFLAKGGPQRDRQALDPDGDGYACGWDPAPFRQAAGN